MVVINCRTRGRTGERCLMRPGILPGRGKGKMKGKFDSKKKKRLMLGLIIFLVWLVVAAACAEPIGFGFVNAKDVALRRGIGGKKVLARLPKDTCVWIHGSETDQKGTEWFHINAGLKIKGGSYNYTGWMKAEFIDAGEKVWNHIVSVSSNNWGMIALRSDGTAETAARPMMVAPVVNQWSTGRGWTDRFKSRIVQVEALYNGFAVLTEEGDCYENYQTSPIGRNIRLIGEDSSNYALSKENVFLYSSDLKWVVPSKEPGTEKLRDVRKLMNESGGIFMLTDQGDTLVALEYEPGLPMPDWKDWTALRTLSVMPYSPGEGFAYETWMGAGIREDGSILSWPDFVTTAVSGWEDMKDIKLAQTYILGLKNDGTAMTAGLKGGSAPDVSHWTDVIGIETDDTYCVGICQDGTLVFAGEHVFMGDGKAIR